MIALLDNTPEVARSNVTMECAQPVTTYTFFPFGLDARENLGLAAAVASPVPGVEAFNLTSSVKTTLLVNAPSMEEIIKINRQ